MLSNAFKLLRIVFTTLCVSVFAACASPHTQQNTNTPRTSILRVVAVESFLADMTQNVTGERIHVETLMPLGADPHSFEPTPQDLKKIAESDVLIMNGAGFEKFLEKLIKNTDSKALVIEASNGLASRTLKPGEPHAEDNPIDPHFWLDPLNAVKYVENIRDGLMQADPAGAEIYQANAAAYISKLNALDEKIRAQVNTLPAAQRKLVTDHDTLGYYADRYGFEIVGMLIPGFSSADTSSAQQLAALVEKIRAARARAIFLEHNDNPQLAEQIARDAGVSVISGLYSHSLSEANGPAPTYLQMLEHNTDLIVNALR